MDFLNSKQNAVYFIAEIGFNHEGSLDLCKKHVIEAANSGADAIKLQTFEASDITLPGTEHFDVIQQGYLDYESHREIKCLCDSLEIDFISTPFSLEKLDWLIKLNAKAIKIASMDANNMLLISKALSYKKPILVSTGMCTSDEIRVISNKLVADRDCLLHCTSSYPTSVSNTDLGVLSEIKNISPKINIGLSDHSQCVTSCIAALSRFDIKVIEKHFTIDKGLPGPDHSISLDPSDLKYHLNKINEISKSLNSNLSLRSDFDSRVKMRRGGYFKKDLPLGHKLTLEDLLLVRPCNEMDISQAGNIIGKKLLKKVNPNQPISKSTVEE